MTATKQKKLDKATLTTKEVENVIAKGVGKILTMEDIQPSQLETTAKELPAGKIKRTNIVELATKINKKVQPDLQTPYVLIDGVVIAPDNVPDFVIDSSKSARSFCRQHPAGGYGFLSILQKGRGTVVLKTYTVKLNGVDIKLFLDENSSFTHTGINLPWGARKPTPSRRGDTLVLLNSSSEDDDFHGDNVLENINSRHSTYRSTTLAIGNNKPGYDYLLQNYNPDVKDDTYLYGLDDTPLEPGITEVIRMEVKNTHFTQSVIRNSLIVPGNYKNANFDNVTIEITGSHKHIYASFKGARFYNVKLSGKHIRSHSSELSHVVVEVDGAITVTNIRMTSENIYGDAAFLNNKFAHAIIQCPVTNLVLLRTTENTFSLGTDYRYGEIVKLKVDDDYATIREAAIKLVVRSTLHPNENYPTPDDPITRSVIKFVTDSIWSRLKLIKLINGAATLDSQVNPLREERYDHDHDHYF